VPVVRRCDHERVHVLSVEYAAEVLHRLRLPPREFGHLVRALRQEPGVAVGKVGDLNVGSLAEAVEEIDAAPPDAHEAEDHLVVRSDAVLRRRKSGCGSQRAHEEMASRCAHLDAS